MRHDWSFRGLLRRPSKGLLENIKFIKCFSTTFALSSTGNLFNRDEYLTSVCSDKVACFWRAHFVSFFNSNMQFFSTCTEKCCQKLRETREIVPESFSSLDLSPRIWTTWWENKARGKCLLHKTIPVVRQVFFLLVEIVFI